MLAPATPHALRTRSRSRMPDPNDPRQNHLLRALPAQETERLFPRLELVPMPLGHVLYESGSQLARVAKAGALDPDKRLVLKGTFPPARVCDVFACGPPRGPLGHSGKDR